MHTLILAAFLAAAGAQATAPAGGNSEQIKAGKYVFSVACAFCHGLDGRGGSRGPDLSAGRRTHGNSDDALKRVITKGVPGTEMPGNELSEEELTAVMSFIRSISAPSAVPVPGSPGAGEKLFFGTATCSQCHMVKGRGGRLGPDLSRVGAARPLRHLQESVRDAGKHITAGFRTVTVVTSDGERITGVRKNEDTFSIQLMDERERLHGFLKSELKEVIHETRSLMPDYKSDMLSEKDLRDLLAYLDSLRGQ